MKNEPDDKNVEIDLEALLGKESFQQLIEMAEEAGKPLDEFFIEIIERDLEGSKRLRHLGIEFLPID
jgi:hypothetical protein